MEKTSLGRILFWFGVFLTALWILRTFTSRVGVSPIFLLLGLLLIFLGRYIQRGEAQVKLPPVPSDFIVAFNHDNIALDAVNKRVWLREGALSRVFSKTDILGWNVQHGTVKAPDMYGGGVITRGNQAKTSIRLAVQTKDMNHPMYLVRFARHNRWINGDANYADAVAWSNRLTAFMNQ